VDVFAASFPAFFLASPLFSYVEKPAKNMASREVLPEMPCVHSVVIVAFSVKLATKLKNVEIDPNLSRVQNTAIFLIYKSPKYVLLLN